MIRLDNFQNEKKLESNENSPKVSFVVIHPGSSDNHSAGERMVLSFNQIEYAVFRWCQPGTFIMGSPEDEIGRNTTETQHQVTFSRGLWMLETQVTQEMWEKVMGDNPSHNKCSRHPVENVSWNDCQRYINKLNELSVDIPGLRFSLPTEAEWEYACRADTTTAYHFGDTINLHEANFEGKIVRDVGSYPANAWGLYDMHGNVWEWCLNWNAAYPNGPVTDPKAEPKGTHRVARGGGWNALARDCRSAERLPIHPALNFSFLGFRLSLVFDR